MILEKQAVDNNRIRKRLRAQTNLTKAVTFVISKYNSIIFVYFFVVVENRYLIKNFALSCVSFDMATIWISFNVERIHRLGSNYTINEYRALNVCKVFFRMDGYALFDLK
jgi:hypothetical protein